MAGLHGMHIRFIEGWRRCVDRVIGRPGGNVPLEGMRDALSAIRMRPPPPRGRMEIPGATARVDAMADRIDPPFEPDEAPPRPWLEWLYALGPVVALTLLGLLTMDRERLGGFEPTVVLVVLPLAARRIWPTPTLIVVSAGALADQHRVARAMDPGLRRRPGKLHGRRAERRSGAFRAGRDRPGRAHGRRLHGPGRQQVRRARPAIRGSRPDVAAGRPDPGPADRRRDGGPRRSNGRFANARCASRPPPWRSAGTSPASSTTSSPTPSA